MPIAVPGLRIASHKALRAAEAVCTRCPLHKNATPIVPGEGPCARTHHDGGGTARRSGGQAGKPFVGPAGHLLDHAIRDSGLDRTIIVVTNAVKHCKFEARGKRRLHKRPNVYEIERCRIWLDAERILVKPEIVVALGATAARSVMGRAVTVSGLRGRIIDLPERERGLVAIHPSWVLRIENETDKARDYRRFVTDLEIVRKSIVRH